MPLRCCNSCFWVGATSSLAVADDRPALDASAVTFAILGGAVGLKVCLYFICVSMRNYSATMLALAEDHLNDIMR